MTAPHRLLPAALPTPIRLVESAGALPWLEVETPQAAAQIYFHGAHVARWQPAEAAAPVLWMSAHSLFEAGKPIRGGVPICFPWFGPHAEDPAAPAHGFARTSEWALVEAGEPQGRATFTLSLSGDGSTAPAWPHKFQALMRIDVGSTLTLALEVRNTDTRSFAFEEALHTYLAVKDIRGVTITGLEATDYLDKVAGGARRAQHREIQITGETDRIYLDTTSACVVHDPGLHRRIRVGKSGSRSTVIWNPWTDKAHRMADFGDHEWPGMLCVETANVGAERITLQPGQSHVMTADISVEHLA
jgi:glucose-6-phosphate 1-epimerase